MKTEDTSYVCLSQINFSHVEHFIVHSSLCLQVRALAKLALQWGRISQTHGANVAVAKTINYEVGHTGLTMKELLFLPPDQVRSTLSQVDSKWVENERMPEKISQTKRQRATSRYTPSAWLSNIVASVGFCMADEFTGPVIKRARTENA